MSKKLFAGEWMEKSSGRHLRIALIDEWKMAEISDWRGNYYADKVNKLVMAEDRIEHRSAYAELVRSAQKLVYRWKAYQHTNEPFVDSAVFVRPR